MAKDDLCYLSFNVFRKTLLLISRGIMKANPNIVQIGSIIVFQMLCYGINKRVIKSYAILLLITTRYVDFQICRNLGTWLGITFWIIVVVPFY